MPDKSFCTTDSTGRTVVADGENEEVLCYVHIGGNAGEMREAFVLSNVGTRTPAAPLSDLPGTATVADLITALNALLARQRVQKIIRAA
ncbi:MAG: hypothetical protein ACTHQM_26455 [Thermoanaerobaculia bacterium]